MKRRTIPQLQPRHGGHSAAVRNRRAGATIVEAAACLPVFLLFLFALFEFCHGATVANTIGAATRMAARYGVPNGVTTAQVETRLNEILGSAINVSEARIQIKDGSVFDDPNVDPETVDYDSLPDIELSEADPRQLFIVRVAIDYDDVSIVAGIPFAGFLNGKTIVRQCIMRHE